MPKADALARLARDGAMIERLASDSRRCAPGTAFFAWPGERGDGRAHIADAIGRGAAAVLWDPQDFDWRDAWRVPNAAVENLRERAGGLADAFYGSPSASMWVCGVTGTNGKTSCSQWIAAALARHGVRAGVIGTLGSGIAGEPMAGTINTTPDALELHRILAGMKDGGARAAAMEVSSHGLAQARVNGVRFRCALFTNLSHEHLDYHGSMQAYAEAKGRLFSMPGLEAAVLNLDDALGARLALRLRGSGLRTIGYGLSLAPEASASVGEYVAVRSVVYEGAATRLALATTQGDAQVTIGQVGRFNVANVLGVLGCLLAYGIGLERAAVLLASLPPVPGRMQRVGGDGRPLVVVDYAHTPDAIENVLTALRPVADASGGRLVIVFGAGGDRDAAKRPLMGGIASRLADRVVITSDNPRSEDPAAILAALRSGLSGAHQLEPDRAKAIEGAIASARAEDVILLAGKGHELFQEAGGRRLPFSDVAVAQQALGRWESR